MTSALEQAVQEDQLGLPRDLGNGLTLRWSTSDDVEEIVQFLANMFANEGVFNQNLAYDLYSWFRGENPTTGPNDFTVVTDANKGGKIISTLTLISHTWTYDNIPFKVGQIEVVATDPEYRRKGLIRQQFEVIHARSALRGQTMQIIGGIPWYYRQFGYDMALAMDASRKFYWSSATKLKKDQTESYQLRPATLEDLPLLKQLYAIHCRSSLITHVRDDAEWHYELAIAHPEVNGHHRRFYMIEKIGVENDSNPIGYVELGFLKSSLSLRELAVLPGNPLRLVCEFLGRALKSLSDTHVAVTNKPEPFSLMHVMLGNDHPGYTAFGNQLSELNKPYAWYIRIADLQGFLRHIAPVLNKRIENSIFDGYSGALRLNFYRSQLKVVIEQGKVTDVGTYVPTDSHDADASFPDLTFLQLLLGYRSLTELSKSYADCYANEPLMVALLETLFPPRSSVVGIAG